MAATFAFLHHLAAFALVAAVSVEFVLLRGDLTVGTARRLIAADAVLGVSAGILLVVGLFRAFLFEKGAGYYLQSGPFIVKLAVFLLMAGLSIVPTRELLSWRQTLAQGRSPAPEPGSVARLRTILHVELAGIVVILLCAALMARGIGSFG